MLPIIRVQTVGNRCNASLLIRSPPIQFRICPYFQRGIQITFNCVLFRKRGVVFLENLLNRYGRPPYWIPIFIIAFLLYLHLNLVKLLLQFLLPRRILRIAGLPLVTGLTWAEVSLCIRNLVILDPLLPFLKLLRLGTSNRR